FAVRSGVGSARRTPDVRRYLACDVLITVALAASATPTVREAGEASSHRKRQPELYEQHLQQLFRGRDLACRRNPIAFSVRELVVQNQQPLTFRRRPGNEQSVFEVRIGMCARKPIRDLAIDGRHLLQRELTHVLPLGPEAYLMK